MIKFGLFINYWQCLLTFSVATKYKYSFTTPSLSVSLPGRERISLSPSGGHEPGPRNGKGWDWGLIKLMNKSG